MGETAHIMRTRPAVDGARLIQIVYTMTEYGTLLYEHVVGGNHSWDRQQIIKLLTLESHGKAVYGVSLEGEKF